MQTPYRDEYIRLKDDSIEIGAIVFSGKEKDTFLFIMPSLNISGYGASKKEAEESFKLNLELFMDDLFSLKKEDRKKELNKLGFKQAKYGRKNYSKVFVDKDGILQNFDTGTLKIDFYESEIA